MLSELIIVEGQAKKRPALPHTEQREWRSYPATPNIILDKVGKSGFTRTRARALVYRHFLAMQYLRMKGQPSVP